MSRWKPLHVVFLLGTLALTIAFVPYHLAHSRALGLELLVSFLMYFTVGMGVTAGYHRLFAHRSYKASWPVRFLLLCFGAASFQDSALQWSSNHRLHHRFVDTERDPYTVKRGFWHAHWIWVLEGKDIPLEGVADLQRDPLLRWQHRHTYTIGAVVACLPLLVGFATHNVWGHLVMGVLLRIVLTHHSTFLINSAAHTFGNRPYSSSSTARDNPFLALLTLGEGYHNFHHHWPSDFRNGVRWYQFDSTKWLLLVLSYVGLVKGLRRTPDSVIRRAKLAVEKEALSARLAHVTPSLAHQLHAQVLAAYQRLDQALASRNVRLRTPPAQDSAPGLDTQQELQQAWNEWKAARFLVRRAA